MSNPEQQEPAPGRSGEEADQPVEEGTEPDEEADEASAESFPSSDPPASYAGPDEPSD
jgi:hypothetical protein